MSLSIAEIAAVLRELQGLEGAKVQKAFVPRERVLVLELRSPGRTQLLLLSAEPNRARLHLVGGRLPAPEEALPFQQQARAHLVGRALVGLEQQGRRVTARFRNHEGVRLLFAELSGRQGNLVLASESGVVIALNGPAQAPGRELAPGKPYPPPAPEEGAAPGLVRAHDPAGEYPLSLALEADYQHRDQAAELRELRARLERPLRSRREKLARTIAKVEQEAGRAGAAEQHRAFGELLKANLHQVRRGEREVLLTDYSSGEPVPVRVPLKPELPPRDNLDWHFHQYRRLSQGSQKAGERLAQLQAELGRLDAELASLPALELEALRTRAPAPRPEPRPRARGEQARLPYREFRGAGGRRLWVGKGAAENDALSFKHARGHDLWLHARGVTGSHVVVPLEKGEQVPPELLLDACALAVHYSAAKGQSHAEVSYLPARYLRKIKGAPGAVTYSQEKTLRYAHEPARIARLLASREEGQ